MKKPILLISVLFLLLINITAQDNTNRFEKEWTQVAQFEKDDLPQSAAAVVDQILKQAIASNNTGQVIKAYFHRNKYKIIIDYNDNTGIFSDLQNLLPTVADDGHKALIHSILAELYLNYYTYNSWKINQRTAIADAPEDIREWPANIFMERITANLDASLQNPEKLHALTTRQYDEIIILGEDSKKYYPTLFDFLMKRTLDISKGIVSELGSDINIDDTGFTIGDLAVPAGQFVKLDIAPNRNTLTLYYYKQYFTDLFRRNLTPTIILTELSKASYLGGISYSFQREGFIDFLYTLNNTYQGNEDVVMIIAAFAENIIDRHESSEVEKRRNLERAFNLINEGISKYPNHISIKTLKTLLAKMESPELKIKGEILYFPHDSTNIVLRHKNLHASEELPVLQLKQIKDNDTIFIKSFTIDFKSAKTYIAEDQKMDLGSLTPGLYTLDLKRDLKPDKPSADDAFTFSVSQLATYSRNSSFQEYEVFVVDRRSGKPAEGATVTLHKAVYDERGIPNDSLLFSTKTDKFGLALFNNIKELNTKEYNNIDYKVSAGDDKWLPAQRISPHYFFNEGAVISNDAEDIAISVFTDRSIYRPGQTVYFKAIVVNSKSLIANKDVTVEMIGSNGSALSEQELTTNEFGSVSGSFVLPQSGLLGQHRLIVKSEGAQINSYFRVEEYKRPTFDITFDKVDRTYAFGQEVTLRGYARTFSGVNLQDANVKYHINGNPLRLWGWSSNGNRFFESGTVTTQPDGSFEIRFTPHAGDIAPGIFRKNIYTFDINASVTDVNGETQNSSFSLIVGNVSMILGIDIPQQIEKSDSSKISISAHNLNMQEIETSGRYEIFALNNNDSIAGSVAEGSFSQIGDQPALLAQIKKLPSGKYRLTVKAPDSNGIEIDAERDFVLFSFRDKRPPYETNEWLVEKNTDFAKGNAEILFGVSGKNMYVLYQIFNEDKIFARQLIKLSNENKFFTIPYKAEYGDGVNLSLTYVRDGRFYDKRIVLTKYEEEDKGKIVVKFETFRDKLRPGDKETWTLSVKDDNNNPVNAEVLASMYDKSLDKIYEAYNHWTLNRPSVYSRYTRASYYQFMNAGSYFSDYFRPIWLNNYIDAPGIRRLEFDHINWHGFPLSNSTRRVYLTGSVANVARKMESSVTEHNAPSIAFDQAVLAEENVAGGAIQSEPEQAPQIRRNFNETAFFYPQLRTNEKGETKIEFTMPESNTTWRFRAFAHNKDLKSGLLEQLVVTRKELMVTPNMPRFLRRGDKTSISAKISNLSDGTISGNARIEFFNPIDDKTIDLNVENRQQSFSLAKDASDGVAWTFEVPAGMDMIGCRIVAGNNKFSDGEQHVLAILPNYMLVTESMPVNVNKEGDTVFRFDKLADNKSTTREDYRLTFEFASNPIWYAVMAMPTLDNPPGESATDWFASYYVNKLGQSIMKRFPQIQTMIELWKKQGDSSTLTSALQQNEELKNILLSETPWVLAARNETEQMQRLSVLFDDSNISNKIQIAEAKLKELQDPMGGWRWFNGMYPSRSITQYILFALADLQNYGYVEHGSNVKEMQMKALQFIDNELRKEYEQLKKTYKDLSEVTSVNTGVLEYLFVRSSYRDIPIDQETREAERFFTSVASKSRNRMNLYERAIFSIVLKRNGDDKQAAQLVRSIQERAVTNSKQGMYWPNNRSKAFISMSAVSNHVFLMKALIENGASEKDTDLMIQWLVRQKQTQAWESANATIDAINILLSTGSNNIDTGNSNTHIMVGNKLVETDRKEPGTGYIKASWAKQEITPDMANVTITRANDKPAFGAMFWQYFEDLDKVTKQGSNELDVRKELYKEVTTSAAGKALSAITESDPLKVGDRVIVRLVMNVAQDMDFVHLRDMRAPCFEPVNTVSATEWRNGVSYYHETRDASTNFFFDRLPKGIYVFEYPVVVNRTGEYSNGITSVQCLYAPEFVSHTQGIKVRVVE